MRHCLSVIICIFVSTAVCQTVEFSAGMGLPEVPNVGARYVDKGLTTGFSYGRLTHINLRTINYDLGFHYGKPARNADAKKSVGRIIYTNYREESASRIFRNSYLSIRFGRNYFFSNHFGLNLEGGFAFEISEETIDKNNNSFTTSDFVDSAVLPSLSLRLFYRLK